VGQVQLDGSTRRPAAYPAAIADTARKPIGPALALFGASLAAGVLGAAPAASGGGERPRPKHLACVSECAGPRAAAEGGRTQITGERLGGVSEVRFAGPVTVPPDRAEGRKLVVTIPPGAVTGRLRLLTAGGAEVTLRERLRVADRSRVVRDFKVKHTRVSPGTAFFDQRRPLQLAYRFQAAERTGVRVEVVRPKGRKVIRTYRKPNRLPFQPGSQAWNGLEGDGEVADDGVYRFRLGQFGERSYAAGQARLLPYKFPIRGGHSYGGPDERFGAPRVGGRVHQGQDVFAACGTPVEAARGGRVQAKAFDRQLYGHYLVIDGHRTRADHMYVHLADPARAGRGDRVHTGQRIGSVGRSGNAHAEPCQLHFELWPNGWRNGSPVDPLSSLRRWDGWS
jgi:murein DD-endopeptidase MepM/ murein hydrolase activator NlpD